MEAWDGENEKFLLEEGVWSFGFPQSVISKERSKGDELRLPLDTGVFR